MDKVRAAVFNALGDAVRNARVLDLFAGSGSYGFEALSRGAKEATFVDSSFEAIKAVKKNAVNLNRENVEILNSDVLTFLKQNTKDFDIIFADPPYKLEIYEELVKTLLERKIVRDSGIIVLESEKGLNIDESQFKSARFYKYGLAKIYILRK